MIASCICTTFAYLIDCQIYFLWDINVCPGLQGQKVQLRSGDKKTSLFHSCGHHLLANYHKLQYQTIPVKSY